MDSGKVLETPAAKKRSERHKKSGRGVPRTVKPTQPRVRDSNIIGDIRITKKTNRPATAAAGGILGWEAEYATVAEARDDTVTDNSMTINEEWTTVSQKIKVWYFRNMDVTDGDLRRIVEEYIPSSSYRYQTIITRGKDLKTTLQNKCWASAYLFDHIRTNVKSYNDARNGANGVHDHYLELDEEQLKEFWTANCRFTQALCNTILNPLRSAVDLDEVWNNPVWKRLFKSVFTIACSSRYVHHLQYTVENKEENKEFVYIKQVYADIRESLELMFPDRPAVSEVPTNRGGVLARGPREIVTAQIGGFTPFAT
ncbi:hypothetical protein MMC06_006459 [Schaereria dolodes]|nr:hypothetical protein [Schaereria dolodes]